MLIKIIDQALSGERQNTIEIDIEELTTPEKIIRARVTKEVTAYNTKAASVFHGLVQPITREQNLNNSSSKFKPIDLEKQVYVALDAFQKNGFFILVDDDQLTTLDQEIQLKTASEINFIKLTPLVGG